MALGSYTTEDGFTLTVYSTLHMDWGLEITDPDGKTVFDNPCYLSNDSYGRSPDPDRFDDWDEAERAALEGDDNAFVPWEENDWQDMLREQADSLLEGCLPEGGER